MMESLLPEAWLRSLARRLAQLEWNTSVERYVDYSFALSAAAPLLAYAIDPGLLPLSLFVPALALLLPGFLAGQRSAKIEAALPDSLYRASSLAGFMPFEEVLGSLSKGGTPLAREFARVRNGISLGIPPEDALAAAAKRNDSSPLRRVCSLLAAGYSAGADMGAALKEAADDISETASAMRERAAGLAMEKWTLLLAGGAIVPFTLGTMVSLTDSLDLGALSDFGLGASGTEKYELRAAAVLGTQIYLAAYSVLAALFVAGIEGRAERSLPYALALVMASSLIFNAAKTGAFRLL